ncbi:DNA-binding response regulator, OmpR family, contains REC and winged-helix (wHTH) domain [Paenibacillus catalpae]|uniref:DNA-binding response regulator, OmpR family, contains REC and winged-helix (WHTH) domain n=1 Tax=Paenibacillus catalpae TaxID=1045775 RepID=A0A1I2GIQ6_9BACL|nr:response regulator transcription factor [Paenibacillus catalpae]SFF16511.1 DNA-binding response regulator, OmpR family, contains REC and winged-helix (wHTH) domain [Paenibacillus catalpae]
MKIMIIEDEPTIRELLGKTVERWGYTVSKPDHFNQLVEDFLKEEPHLILLDINLPTFDGFYWCQKIREISQVPILFISSRDTPMDMIMAMNMGGDDFIQKPFDSDVLMAKINALLRRSYAYMDTQSNVLEHNGVLLNLKDWEVHGGDETVSLTKTEFVILKLLLQQKGTIISRHKIMRSLWKDESFVDDNTLTVNINRLRKKLTDIGKGDLITTKKGEGYIIQ